jgi:hypothetical protein
MAPNEALRAGDEDRAGHGGDPSKVGLENCQAARRGRLSLSRSCCSRSAMR